MGFTSGLVPLKRTVPVMVAPLPSTPPTFRGGSFVSSFAVAFGVSRDAAGREIISAAARATGTVNSGYFWYFFMPSDAPDEWLVGANLVFALTSIPRGTRGG